MVAETRVCFERMKTRRMDDEGDGEREDHEIVTDAPYCLDRDYLEAVIETKGA